MSGAPERESGPHVAAQVAASWTAADAARRSAGFEAACEAARRALGRALDEFSKARDFVGSPENILGSPDTKHGEIAEHVHVHTRRALDFMLGRDPSATLEGIPRTGPVDYQQDGVDIQSKFLNGLRNTIDGVGKHAGRNGDFVQRGSRYHIPSDQHEQLQSALKTGKIDGYSPKKVQTIVDKIEQLSAATGRAPEDLIQPSEATYAEVQQGRVHETIADRERSVRETSDEQVAASRAEHGPSLEGMGTAAAMGAAAGGGVRLGQALYTKWREGKNPFKGEFTAADWQDLGVETAKGGAGGAVAGAGVYLLTNATDLAAPFAGSLVSGLMGIGALVNHYHSGIIDADEFAELALFVAADAAIVGLASVAGQALIPVPVLGAFLGSLAGKLVASALKSSLGNSQSELIQRLEAYEAQALALLDEGTRKLLGELDAHFTNLQTLAELAFNTEANLALRVAASIRFAESVGVPSSAILRTTDDLDAFMME